MSDYEDREPDWNKLRNACDRLEEFRVRGGVTREEWNIVFAEAESAVGDHTEFLEGILMQGAMLGFVTRS